MTLHRCKTPHTCPTCTTAVSVEVVEHLSAEAGVNVLRNSDCSTTARNSAAAELIPPILESDARIDWLFGAAFG